MSVFFAIALKSLCCTSFGNSPTDRARFNEARSSFGRHAFCAFIPATSERMKGNGRRLGGRRGEERG